MIVGFLWHVFIRLKVREGSQDRPPGEADINGAWKNIMEGTRPLGLPRFECLSLFQIHRLKLNLQGGSAGAGRPLGRDSVMRVKSSWMRLVPSWKSPQRKILCPFYQVRTQREDTVYEPGSKASPDTSLLVLWCGRPASRNLRHRCLLLISHPAVVFCYSSPKGLRRRQMEGETPRCVKLHHFLGVISETEWLDESHLGHGEAFCPEHLVAGPASVCLQPVVGTGSPGASLSLVFSLVTGEWAVQSLTPFDYGTAEVQARFLWRVVKNFKSIVKHWKVPAWASLNKM